MVMKGGKAATVKEEEMKRLQTTVEEQNEKIFRLTTVIRRSQAAGAVIDTSQLDMDNLDEEAKPKDLFRGSVSG